MILKSQSGIKRCLGSVGFDEFTRGVQNGAVDSQPSELKRRLFEARLAKDPQKMELAFHDLPLDHNEFRFPWTFRSSVSPFPEENLTGLLPFQKALDPQSLSDLASRFLAGLQARLGLGDSESSLVAYSYTLMRGDRQDAAAAARDPGARA